MMPRLLLPPDCDQGGDFSCSIDSLSRHDRRGWEDTYVYVRGAGFDPLFGVVRDTLHVGPGGAPVELRKSTMVTYALQGS